MSVTRFAVVLFLMFSFTAGAQAQEAPAQPEYTISQVMPANFPVAMTFTPNGDLFYTEKATGNVRLIHADGNAQIEPVISLPTDALVERGLIGIALDPNYADNGYIWVYHTQPGTAQDYPANAIVRFHEENGVGTDPVTMLTVPITNGELKHNGGNLHFAPDGSLYVAIGDNGTEANAQDMRVIPGKMHHFIVRDNQLFPAPDNPNPDSSIFAYGLRNTFDFTFDPLSGVIFASENGLHCDDEINRLLAGRNYGWGTDYGTECFGMTALEVANYQAPILSYNPTVAPTGITIYNQQAIPAWQGDLFFCEWNTGQIQHVVLNEQRNAVKSIEALDLDGAACRTDIEVAPDGSLVFFDVSMIYRLTVKG